VITEADTCRKYVLPKLYAAGWTDDQIYEQKTFTNGKVQVIGNVVRRRKQKRTDYLLKYDQDIMIAVVEAKSTYRKSGDGLQQAMEYANILDIKFAYSTNGKAIIEHDFTTGKETELNFFPSPSDLWYRLNEKKILDKDVEGKLLSPMNHKVGKIMRYYQEIAINRSIRNILKNNRRILITMATGTGKTTVSLQIIWKLWNSKWNARYVSGKPRILYLSDRNILIDDPKKNDFTIFGDARYKIQREAILSREIYFATYQAIAKDSQRPGLYKEFPKDFFDLIIIDECHRGSARDESNWREILEYFVSAYQIGMTATPLREDNVDTYKYFGNPIYTYSLKQGIDDGFLAPFKVFRIVTDVDASGWRPTQGQVDRYKREIPDEVYGTSDFDRIIALKARTKEIARNISDYLKRTDRFAKTIVFCVDMEHAAEMRMALINENSDLVKKYPVYVSRVVSEEGDIGLGNLDKFQDVETLTPTIVTTSKLLTTGVDMPMVKNIVIAKVINSMTDFKQTIGRGTRVREDYGKLYFNILDYTGSAIQRFADPAFDGTPALLTEEEMNELGERVENSIKILGKAENEENEELEVIELETPRFSDDSEGKLRKYYVDEGEVHVIGELAYEIDGSGHRQRVIKYTDYTREKVCSMFTNAADLRSKWGIPEEREAVINSLKEHGIVLEDLMDATKMYDADRFDLLCHVAFNGPIRTRRERAENVRKGKKDFFERYAPVARQILNEILDKYIEFGIEQFKTPDILKVPPIDSHGNVMEIAKNFGNAENMRRAVNRMQQLLYELT
jgi:type I restriction enzyme R subunit